MRKSERYKFRKSDTVGAAEAEEDHYLEYCFVDTGDLDVLCDCSDPQRIIVGRTGSGKTALIERISSQKDNVIRVSPEKLSFIYISNSNILSFLTKLDVKIDVLFKLLWRHIFTTEILKHRYKINSDNNKERILSTILEKIKNAKQHKKAIEYLNNWGEKFWEETDCRVKEVTTNIEESLQAAINAKGVGISGGISSSSAVSQGQKEEIIQRVQNIINQVQVKELTGILDFLNQVMDDPQKNFYITIDGLDENWVDEALRYKLIKALIETVKDFRRVRNVKIIIAIRFDLLGRVFRCTRDPGFQEEKYESLYLNLIWNKKQLTNVLDSRINFLIQDKYTRRKVTHKNIMPGKIKNKNTADYLLARTMMRPRDIILFFNQCIKEAVSKPSITAQMVVSAEGEYSRSRLASIYDEWYSDYPNLSLFVDLLKNKKKKFYLKDIKSDEVANLCLDITIKDLVNTDILTEMARKVSEGEFDMFDFLKLLFLAFYKIRIVGLQLDDKKKSRSEWSVSGRRGVSSAEVSENTVIEIHPMFWRVLGIK